MALSNNATRVLVAIVAIPVVVGASYFGGIYFFLFTFLISTVAFYEFSVLAKNKGANVNLWVSLLSIILLLINQYSFFVSFLSIILLTVFVLSLTELFRNKDSAIINLGTTLLGIFYIGLFSTALLGIREFYQDDYNRGGYIIIAVLATIWICDSAAYYGGTAFGKHKLFKRVSPNKSWEGAIFGFIFALATMILAKIIILNFLSWNTIIALGFIVGIFGQVGDLIESLIKRDAGVKDSSTIIPGHGGIFDRFDSLLYTAPLIFLYLSFFER